MTTITLEDPIESGGRTIKEVKIRTMKVRDVEKLTRATKGRGGRKDDFEASVDLVSDLTELTPDEVRELSVQDYGAIQEVVGDFLERYKPKTEGSF